jgi:hypothetical protein
MPTRIREYVQAFKAIGVPYDNKAKLIVKMLAKDGRTEGSICYAIWKELDTLRENKDNKEFWKIFGDAVKKWSWSRDDPRWIEYKKKKFQQNKAKKYQENAIKERTFKKPAGEELEGFIYFIQGECGGPIKIGYTADLKRRITSLQTGYPDRLELLLAFPGNQELEKTVHKIFEQYRLKGEWFQSSPEVLEKIQKFAYWNTYMSDVGGDMMQIRL